MNKAVVQNKVSSNPTNDTNWRKRNKYKMKSLGKRWESRVIMSKDWRSIGKLKQRSRGRNKRIGRKLRRRGQRFKQISRRPGRGL